MARLVAIVLLLTLVVVSPAASAEPPNRGAPPIAGWLDAIRGAVDRVLSWVPTLRAETREHGAYIVPNGVRSTHGDSGAYIIPNGIRSTHQEHGAYIVPSGIRSTHQESGAYIIPDGIRSGPGMPEGRRPGGRASIQRR